MYFPGEENEARLCDLPKVTLLVSNGVGIHVGHLMPDPDS